MILEELRQEISAIDSEMRDLFIRRMQIVRDVAEYKRERGLPIEDEQQEMRIIEKQIGEVGDEELKSYYSQFMHSTMMVSKRYQHRLLDGQSIAFCGDAGSEDYRAVRHFYPEATPVGYPDHESAYKAVESGECDLAVLPFERSYVGETGRVLDLMFAGQLHVNAMREFVQDSHTTRYAVLSQAESEGADNGSAKAFLIMFTVKDETGALAKAVNVISAYDYNMRIMRSRPMSDLPWHYYFYAEAEGEDTSDNGRRMLNALRVACPMVKVLGRYNI